MAESSYEKGDLVRCSAAFTDLSGTPTDPTTIAFTLLQPDGTTIHASYAGSIVKDSTGNYHYDVTPTQVGPYSYQFTSTGPVQRTVTAYFVVRQTGI